MHVVHANWSADKLRIWAESGALWAQHAAAMGANGDARAHPFAAPAEESASVLSGLPGIDSATAGEMDILLPDIEGSPSPSTRMAHAVGHAASETAVLTKPSLRAFRV